MSSRTIVCSDCGEAVPYGRLSCPACGALLASVAGGARTSAAASGATSSLEPDPDDTLSAWASAPSPASGSPSAASDVPVGTGPGAYIPSVAPTPTSMAGEAIVTSPPAGAAAVPTPRAPDVIPLVATAAPRTAAASTTPPPAPTAAGTSIRTTTSRPAMDGLPRWLDRAVAVGGGLIGFGLLLPWSSVVIGSKNVGGYLDTWGLAGPWQVLVLIAAIALAAIAVIPNPFPAWARSGLPAIGLGAFAIGLVWPYLVGPLGGAIGSVIALLGGLVAIVAGVLVVGQGRHIAGGPGV